MAKNAVEKSTKNSRGDAVVTKVLAAAREELATVGYRAFRMEDVATRAEVHKTTIYRRWPTKRELVQDAMLALSDEIGEVPDSGSLREDLVAILRHMTQFMTSVAGQGAMRMIMAEGTDPDVAHICIRLRDNKEATDRVVMERAIARGELRPDVDAEMLIGMLFGPVHHRLFMLNQRVDELYLARLVDLVLLGASPRTPGKNRNE